MRSILAFLILGVFIPGELWAQRQHLGYEDRVLAGEQDFGYRAFATRIPYLTEIEQAEENAVQDLRRKSMEGETDIFGKILEDVVSDTRTVNLHKTKGQGKLFTRCHVLLYYTRTQKRDVFADDGPYLTGKIETNGDFGVVWLREIAAGQFVFDITQAMEFASAEARDSALEEWKKLVPLGEGFPGDNFTINPVSADEIVVGERVQYTVRDGNATVDNSRVRWDVIKNDAANPFADPRRDVVGRISDQGLFEGVALGRCVVRAYVDETPVDKEVTVVCCRDKKSNFQEFIQLYRRRIPEGPVMEDLADNRVSPMFTTIARRMKPGTANNFLESFGYKKYGAYVCGSYQGDVTKFLCDVMTNPKTCHLLRGYEFSMIQGYAGGHYAVVLFPEGEDPMETGYVLDPWPTQTPEVYKIEVWKIRFAKASVYSTSKRSLSSVKEVCRALVADFEELRAKDGKPKSVGSVHCPVNLLVVDNAGRRSGMTADGEWLSEIPGARVMRLVDESDDPQWYFELADDADEYSIEIQGTADGRFQAVTARVDEGRLANYGEREIGLGETAVLTISGSGVSGDLRLPDGEQIAPEMIVVRSRSNWPWIVALLCGVVLTVLVCTFFRRRTPNSAVEIAK